MKPSITIVDYGMGNLFSVTRAFEHCGADVIHAQTPEQIDSASRLVLPGVGAFRDGMLGLKELGFIEPIRKFASSGKPFLGICLGMQMMLDSSEEFGTHEGLGLIPGKVVAIPKVTADGQPHKIPHIGWSAIVKPDPSKDWQGTILQDMPDEASVYFVHSYTAVPLNSSNRLADCRYNGQLISAAIHSGQMFGVQFHPEKSGETGLRMIRNFLSLS